MPSKIDLYSDEEFEPVVRVREAGKNVSPAQKEQFEKLLEEGKKLYQEEMDYENAIEKFKEAENLASTREQKSEVLFYLSLAHYANLGERGNKEFEITIRKLIETDYYRELYRLICPPRYTELFRRIKKEYGALKILSIPAGADVYINDSHDSVGKTPLTIGAKAGPVRIRVKKGKKEKKDIIQVAADKETITPVYALKRGAGFLYVVGGILLAGGVGAVLLSQSKEKSGETRPTTGSIEVNSTPAGAEVFLDGNNTGQTTNCLLTDISPGDHTVKLVKEGYLYHEQAVSVVAGETTVINVTLSRHVYVFVTKWGNRGSGRGEFNLPRGINTDRSGYIYVADLNDRIQKFTSNGNYVTKWGNWGSGNGEFSQPAGIAVDNSGYVYVVDSWNHRIQKFTSNGSFEAKWGTNGAGEGQFNEPWGIAVDDSGYVYVADTLNNRVQKFTSNGNFLMMWESSGCKGITVDGSGNVYVTDVHAHRIKKFTSNGSLITQWGSRGIEDGQIDTPWGIAMDNSGHVFVAERNNFRMQKFTPEGNYMTKWGTNGSGNGEFDFPEAIAVDPSGYVYVADTYNHRIQKFKLESSSQSLNGNKLKLINNDWIHYERLRPKLLRQPHPNLKFNKQLKLKEQPNPFPRKNNQNGKKR